MCRLLSRFPVHADRSSSHRDPNTRYTLALPIPNLTAISVGLTPLAFSRMILIGLSPGGRHTAFVADITGDAVALALQHGLPVGLPHSTDHGQHQPAGACGGIEGLIAGHRQDPQGYLRFEPSYAAAEYLAQHD
jgi:hypothetical protein